MKYYYRSLKENPDYIVLGNRDDFFELISERRILENTQVEDMIKTMYYSLYLFEQESKLGYVDLEFVIRKDSFLGMFMLNNPDMFIDDANYISYDKVIGSYLISSYQEQSKMNNKIFRLLKERKTGTKQELMSEHSEYVLDYILENSDYNMYLRKLDEKVIDTNKKYIVYEDDYYSIRNFENNKNSQKVKSEQAS